MTRAVGDTARPVALGADASPGAPRNTRTIVSAAHCASQRTWCIRQSSLAAERLAELDQRGNQIARRLAEIQDELARIARSTVSLVPKPIELQNLERAFDDALTTAPDLAPLVRAAVGHLGVHEVEAQVRTTMVSEALARAHGSRHGAARMLAVSRQLLQHILKRRRWTSAPSPGKTGP